MRRIQGPDTDVEVDEKRVVPLRPSTRGTVRRDAAERRVATEPSEDEAAWVDTVVDRDGLVHEHLWLVDRLVGQTARRFPTYVERSDLWSAGVLGLVEAARRYDTSFNVPFAAYASARVRGEMLETARGADLASRRLRRSLRELAEVVERLTHDLGRVPRLEEVAEAAHLDLHLVRQRLDSATALAQTSSLDANPATADTSPALGDHDADPAEILTEQELIGALREAVDHLPEPLKSVLVRSHWNNERLVDIAADMGITFQRVAQYRAEAITAITAWFANLYDAVPTPDASLPGSVRRASYCSTLSTKSTWLARLDAGRGRLDDS
jgi:RNA polymerase sigma factor for flagellar operon FliA